MLIRYRRASVAAGHGAGGLGVRVCVRQIAIANLIMLVRFVSTLTTAATEYTINTAPKTTASIGREVRRGDGRCGVVPPGVCRRRLRPGLLSLSHCARSTPWRVL